MSIQGLTLVQLKKALESGRLTSEQAVLSYREAFELDKKHDLPINAYVEFFDDALDQARKTDEARRLGKELPLLGLPFAIKDNISIAGKSLTCASKILQGYKAPYHATVIERLAAAGAVFLGRTNMDEFAMGSSCEFSCYRPTRHPLDRNLTVGGSSGGSAAAVAAGQAPFALGSDTGGSVRLPAAFTNLYGFKPGYGTLSRYGLVAFGSSLDQIGYLAKAPEDLALVLQSTVGQDPYDQTSLELDLKDLFPLSSLNIEGLKVAIPEQLIGEGLTSEVQTVFKTFIDWLVSQGAQVNQVSVPLLEAAVAIYYIIAPAEASSNLSRFDGIRYGTRADENHLFNLYCQTRGQGFGPEVKRRIFVGNYVLSSGYIDAYYKKAQIVRKQLTYEITKLLGQYDFLLSPTSPTPPFRLGTKIDDSLTMYLSDVCTVCANLTGVPALSIPGGLTTQELPVGIQLMSALRSEGKLLGLAQHWHTESYG